MDAPVSPTPQLAPASAPKPQKVQLIGILTIISGALNISMGLGLMIGLAVSVILLCCAPIGALPLALGVYEVIYGIRLIGSGREPVSRDTMQTIAVLEIVTLLVSNLPSAVIGIVDLILLSDSEVMAYFQSPPSSV
jgi:hypothetical protein